MLHQTKAIVFKTTPYNDKTNVVQLYTKLFGIQSYLVSTNVSKKSKTKSAYFEPLTLLDIVITHKEREGLNAIREISIAYNYSTISHQIEKQSIFLFINEVLYKCIKESQENTELFNFIFDSLLQLDTLEKGIANFHIYFLLKLSSYLGFEPHGKYTSSTPFFDLKEGLFVNFPPKHPAYLNNEESLIFYSYLLSDIFHLHDLHFSNVARKNILQKMIVYYELHIDYFRNINSLAVLEAVFE